nr:integrase, catalytic region, zinc finger, CCHC-type, peptidase aspartic, catalytic [Tanacetum cinerariifolium]
KPVPDSDGNLTTTTKRVFETYKNVKQDIRDQLNAEAKASQELKTVSYHKLYDILKQHQHEVNEIRAEKIARVANPLALVAQQQPVYHPQTHPTHYKHNSSTRSQQAANRNIEKAIVNSPQPIYDQEPSMVDEDDEMIILQRLTEMLGMKVKGLVAGAREIVESEAHYMYMAKVQEVSPDAVDSGPIFDTDPEQKNDEDIDIAKERELLASLIEKLKCEIDESKNRNKFLETSNKDYSNERCVVVYMVAASKRDKEVTKPPWWPREVMEVVAWLLVNLNLLRKLKEKSLETNKQGVHNNWIHLETYWKPTALKTNTHKPVVTLVYSRKPRKSKTNVPVSKPKVVQIVLWYLNFGCSKHMTEDCSQLTNFVSKFLGTVKFGNDHVAKIMGYGDYQIGDVTVSRVYYVEVLG